MPTRSPSSARTVRELGLPGRAVSALERAGVLTVRDLERLTSGELTRIPGLGRGMVTAIRAVVAEPHAAPDREEAPAAPEIPSFASLRSPRRRSAIDVLLPGTAAAPAAPRPAEYADLLRFGARVARSAAGVSWRLARWSAGTPVRCLRRVLGG